MGVFTLPNREKYDALPENFRGEIRIVFEEKTGRGFGQYLAGNSLMTPRQELVYQELLEEYDSRYQSARKRVEVEDE